MRPLLCVNMDKADGIMVGYIMPFSLHVSNGSVFPCLMNPYLDHNQAIRAPFPPGYSFRL